jgi:hypothetical protein
MDNFPSVCFFFNNWTNANFKLHDEQTVNRLWKIVSASVFHLKQQHIYICCPFNIYSIGKFELTENGNFRLFAANGKQKRQTSVCLLRTDMENGCLFSFAGKLLICNRRLLFQQTCSSMEIPFLPPRGKNIG